MAAPVYVDLDSAGYPGKNYELYYNAGIKSAPGKYKFDISGSKNSVSYELRFGDGRNSGDRYSQAQRLNMNMKSRANIM